MEWVLVAVGGALGAMSRFAVGRSASAFGSGIPLGTLLVNVVGCLLAGLFIQWVSMRAPDTTLRPLVQVGFFGAFTTFSAFSVDTWNLFQSGHYMVCLLYTSPSPRDRG